MIQMKNHGLLRRSNVQYTGVDTSANYELIWVKIDEWASITTKWNIIQFLTASKVK